MRAGAVRALPPRRRGSCRCGLRRRRHLLPPPRWDAGRRCPAVPGCRLGGCAPVPPLPVSSGEDPVPPVGRAAPACPQAPDGLGVPARCLRRRGGGGGTALPNGCRRRCPVPAPLPAGAPRPAHGLCPRVLKGWTGRGAGPPLLSAAAVGRGTAVSGGAGRAAPSRFFRGEPPPSGARVTCGHRSRDALRAGCPRASGGLEWRGAAGGHGRAVPAAVPVAPGVSPKRGG